MQNFLIKMNATLTQGYKLTNKLYKLNKLIQEDQLFVYEYNSECKKTAVLMGETFMVSLYENFIMEETSSSKQMMKVYLLKHKVKRF